ncbi:SCP-like protein [Ancylostoma duodenale]|uniref:SCP-like protein n=1 Tax=Ancylostoma duodenale TaxID=51022 RepID=A0A0C2G944_9BILA|nr:SCP-like protein [Ancylostoma duodenale]
MTGAARRAFLNTHNRFRSRLAKGRESNGNLGFAPQAANMQKMEYDCFAENSALVHARTCSGKLSDPATRLGLKENFVEINKIHLNLVQTARHASTRWWNEMSLYGVNPTMSFTAEMRRATTGIVRHFGKMSSVTTEMGTALQMFCLVLGDMTDPTAKWELRKKPGQL